MAGGPIVLARNFAVMTGVNAALSRALKLARGGVEDATNRCASPQLLHHCIRVSSASLVVLFCSYSLCYCIDGWKLHPRKVSIGVLTFL